MYKTFIKRVSNKTSKCLKLSRKTTLQNNWKYFRLYEEKITDTKDPGHILYK